MCSTNSLTGNGSQTGNAVCGILVDDYGDPVEGALVTVYKSDYLQFSVDNSGFIAQTTTNSDGLYQFGAFKSGNYNIVANKGLKSTYIDCIQIDDTVPLSIPTDTVRLSGSISGTILLAGLDMENQIRAVLQIPGTGFSTRPYIGGSFSFNNIPQGSYKLIIEPTDSDFPVKVLDLDVSSDLCTKVDTIIFYSKSITGVPKINAGADCMVETYDTITLKGTASDTLGKYLHYFWDIGNTGEFVASIDGIAKFSPKYATDSLICIFKVTDNDGNSVKDTTILKVVAGIPIASANPVANTVTANDTIIVIASVIDMYGTSFTVQWDPGKTGTFTTTTNCTLVTIAPATVCKAYPIVLKVKDNTGKIAYDTTAISVLQKNGPMVSILSSGESLNMKSIDCTITFSYNFWMDTTEVTQHHFDSIMSSYADYTPGHRNNGNGPLYPIYNVNWFNAILYCNARSKLEMLDTAYQYTSSTGIPGGDSLKLHNVTINLHSKGYRLPTEAEWEFSCRAGTSTPLYWGSSVTGKYEWFAGNSGNQSHEVATKNPNGFSLYDMAGNVWEWCHDWYSSATTGNITISDYSGPSDGRDKVLRGGYWGNSVTELNSDYRYWSKPDVSNYSIGFRTVRPMQ